MPRGDVSAVWCVPGDGDRFCEDCGAPLGRCPSCGEPVTPGETAIAEARDIATRLRCQPRLDRAANLTPARPPYRPSSIKAFASFM